MSNSVHRNCTIATTALHDKHRCAKAYAQLQRHAISNAVVAHIFDAVRSNNVWRVMQRQRCG